MLKTKNLIVVVVGIAMFGLGIVAFASNETSSGYFIDNYSPGYPQSSEIPLYEGNSSPSKIPEYENDVGISLIDPQ